MQKDIKVIFKGKFSNNISKINTVTKLLKLLDKNKLLKKDTNSQLKKTFLKSQEWVETNECSDNFKFLSKKIISKKQKEKFAKKIGSDVILSLINRQKYIMQMEKLG